MASAALTASDTPRFSPRRQKAAVFVLALSNFMVVLDMTIANVSIPHIAGSMGISLEQGTWIITSYAVAEAICVPLTGWLAERFGTVRVFMAAMLGFGLFSLICGISLTLGMLVVARIGQGFCGGPLMPMSQTLMMRILPPEKRAGAMGIWAMTVILGPALGPILGGYISDNFSWHWIFLINVPIAALCIVFALTLLSGAETPTVRKPIDRMGLGLMVFWIACLQIILDIGRDHDWFGDTKIVILAIMAAVGFVAFVIWEMTDEHPVVDVRVFRHRGFSAAMIVLACAFGSFFSSVVIIPQWLQMSMGYTATDAGMLMALQSAASLTMAPLVPRLVSKVDPRLLLSGGLAWMGMATFIRLGWNTDADFWSLAVPMMLQGLGIPFMMVTITIMTLSSVDPEETASAAGLQNFVRTIFAAIATATILTMWSNAQRVSRNDMVDVLQPDAMQSTLGGMGINSDAAREMISGMVDKQAALVGMLDVFQWTGVLFLFAAAVVWIIPRPKVGAADPMMGAH